MIGVEGWVSFLFDLHGFAGDGFSVVQLMCISHPEEQMRFRLQLFTRAVNLSVAWDIRNA